MSMGNGVGWQVITHGRDHWRHVEKNRRIAFKLCELAIRI